MDVLTKIRKEMGWECICTRLGMFILEYGSKIFSQLELTYLGMVKVFKVQLKMVSKVQVFIVILMEMFMMDFGKMI